MPTGLAQDTTKSAKNLAQQIAKQMAQEPLEILKQAREQVSGEEISERPNSQSPEQSDEQKKLIHNQNELQDKMKASRRIEAFQRELDDIRKQTLFRDLQYKISQGIDVPLEDYPELTIEEKQVLMAQKEAVKMQIANSRETESAPLFGSSKKSRRFGQGQKQQAQKEQTRVEKPVPPSG